MPLHSRSKVPRDVIAQPAVADEDVTLADEDSFPDLSDEEAKEDRSPFARARFRDAYGDIPPAAWQRARFYALHYGAVLIEYGVAVGDAALLRVGQDALRFAVADE